MPGGTKVQAIVVDAGTARRETHGSLVSKELLFEPAIAKPSAMPRQPRRSLKETAGRFRHFEYEAIYSVDVITL
jgi:hypothetical protein